MPPFDADNIENKNAIALLTMQQSQMHEDIKQINSSLRTVAEALKDLAVLEQKHNDSMTVIKRAHTRIDKLESDLKEDYKKHEKRIQDLELHDAKTIWIERLVMVVLVGVLTLWVKGGI